MTATHNVTGVGIQRSKHTVKSAYTEHGYKEFPVIRNSYLFSNIKQETISLYVY